MIDMPIVELVAKKTLEMNPDIGLDVVDLIVLLWMYSNPYDNNRFQNKLVPILKDFFVIFLHII